jgi:pimeloyl-ACP methyl ester carboxylesterase
MTDLAPLDPSVLPPTIRSRFLDNVNGLRIHILESGYATTNRPLVLLLHGFPELAYSWRKIMPPLAEAGFHVVAPDLRGYGRTTGWDVSYDSDLRGFRLLNAVRDALGVIWALGHQHLAGVVGHDFGSPVAAWCALVRPDVFRTLTLMSAPFAGPPAPPDADARAAPDIHAALAALDRPRKHYQWYYSTRPANADMLACKQGVHDFLRAYYHHKSADWHGDKPFRLAGWTAEELAKMPTYYIMDLHEDMPTTVAHEMPSAAEIDANRWLPDQELAVYATEYTRTGFQGGLQWYRRGTGGLDASELQLFCGRTIDVPSMFIAGASDWGTYQNPGAFERMQQAACTRMTDVQLIEGAGHWVQQEQPARVSEALLHFLRR